MEKHNNFIIIMTAQQLAKMYIFDNIGLVKQNKNEIHRKGNYPVQYYIKSITQYSVNTYSVDWFTLDIFD